MQTDVLPLVQRALRESFRALLGWSAGLAGVCLLYLPLYQSMGGSASMQQMIDSLPKQMIAALGFQEISTGAGYVQSTVLGLLGFVLLSIAAINWGTAAVAGAEEHGELELTLAHAVTRTQVVLEGSLALVIRLMILCALLLAVLLALNEPSRLGIAPSSSLAGVLALGSLTLMTGMMSLATGALVRSKPAALLAGTAVTVAGYILNALGNQSTDLRWLHDISAYSWAFGESPLSTGIGVGGLALLIGISALLVIIAVAGMCARDVGT